MTDVKVPGVAGPTATPSRQPLVKRWITVLATTNPPRGEMDPVSKWLYLTRAGVLPMTMVSAALAGLLAAYRDASVRWGLFALSAIGLVLAHMANNLMNDLFDLEVGTDTENYPRNLYSPHPVLSGAITRRGLAACALVVNALLPRDHARAVRRARRADRRLRVGWLLPVAGLHRAAAAAQEARPRRTDRHRGVGSAHGRRHLLRGDGHDPRRGAPRVAAVRDAQHDGVDGQAHRQARMGRAGRHAHCR